MSSIRAGLLLVVLLLLLGVGAAPASAQGRAYTLDQVVTLVGAGVSTNIILERVRTTCIDFPLDAEAERRLTASGAEQALIAGLRTVCRPSVPSTPEETPPQQAVPSRPTESATTSQVPGNPWSGFRLRAIGYAVTAAAGAGAMGMTTSSSDEYCDPNDCYLRTTTEAPYQTIGAGLLAASAAALAFDWLMTSRRARPVRISRALTIEGPQIATKRAGATPSALSLNVLCLRF